MLLLIWDGDGDSDGDDGGERAAFIIRTCMYIHIDRSSNTPPLCKILEDCRFGGKLSHPGLPLGVPGSFFSNIY